ncbi:unnamed protein product [Nezara viridula]|uniref:Gustatory receptor n=1 Tax=Nezara viridula TaxID=85310 RepID=A0A9P0MKB1_NEZVI|nr:unnamed protein product [Nezara viridula]
MFIIYQQGAFAENAGNRWKNSTTFTNKHCTLHRKVQSHQLLGNNIYFNQMKPIFVVLRIVGRFPYSFTKTGIAPFSFMSWAFLYSLAFNVAFCVMTTYSVRKIIRDKIYPSQSFDEIMFWCLPLLFGIQSFLGPITFWWDAPRTVKYFKKWKDFEDLWRCRKMYSVKRLRYTRIMSASIIPMTIIIFIYETSTIPKISLFIFLPYIPILVTDLLMLGHWWLTLHDLTLYAEHFLISIFKIGSYFTKKLLQMNLPTLEQNGLNEFASNAVTYLIVLVQMKAHPKALGLHPIQGSGSNKTM